MLAQKNGDRMTTAQLEAEARLRRNRLSENMDELSERMTPANLLYEASQAFWARIDNLADNVLVKSQELAEDSMDWARQNRFAVGGSIAALLAGGVLVWSLSRRQGPVPLYAAYDMEDPNMLDDTDEKIEARAKAAWGKVKGEAHDLGDKAEEAYRTARQKAVALSEDARERAKDAARIAREKAHEAAEAAREAADRAREVAGDAGKWAKRQPQEHPATMVVAALAAGVLIGALIPAFRRNHEE